MSYKIGSFNICNFNDPQQSNRQKSADISLIAKIIKEEAFDIIALQEVLREEVLRDYLIPKLNEGSLTWDYRWGKPKKSDNNEAEGYAFIWNTNTMELSTHNQIEYVNGVSSVKKHIAEPHIYNQYRIDSNRGEFSVVQKSFLWKIQTQKEFLRTSSY